ncbi:MAG: glycosyltransferase [Anaerolineae bacterium]|nr:glycosyltransferase [Anaerolineae bacterium]
MRLALVHDWLNQIGGAEDVLKTLVGMFPQAPIYTSMYWQDGMPDSYRSWPIHTTWMNHLPGVYRHHQAYLPLYPAAFGHLDLSDYEVILSNKSGFCHGLRKGHATHICYCLAPTRYVWEFDAYAAREALSPAIKTALRPLVRILQRWDYAAAQRVDTFIAISGDIQRRIRKYYERDSVVIYPPVDTARFQPGAAYDNYYLIVSRLVPYRRINLAIEAFNTLRLPLVIAGDGRDRAKLESLAGPNITFLDRVPDEDLPGLYTNCQAYILPGLEDFGIAPVQAQAAGRPVIAFAGGGALDTVIEGETGTFFHKPEAQSLAAAVTAFDAGAIDPGKCRSNAERFGTSVFKQRIRRIVEDAWKSRNRD